MKIRTSGRTDLDDFFRQGPALAGPLPHTPFLVFIACADGDVEVKICDRAELLADYPPDTPVMAQWPGRYRSDFFQMTAGAVVEALAARRALDARIHTALGGGGPR